MGRKLSSKILLILLLITLSSLLSCDILSIRPVSDLKATDLKDGRVKLSWKASSSENIVRYDISYKTGDGASHEGSVDAPKTEWISGDVAPGKYEFKVTAVNNRGKRSRAIETSITISKGEAKESPPAVAEKKPEVAKESPEKAPVAQKEEEKETGIYRKNEVPVSKSPPVVIPKVESQVKKSGGEESSYKPLYTEVGIIVNGQPVSFITPPLLISDRVMAPSKELFGIFGAYVQWEEDTKTVTVWKGEEPYLRLRDRSLNYEIVKSGRWITRSEPLAPLYIWNGRSMISLRFAAEKFGAEVYWDKDTSTISISFAPPRRKGPIFVYQREGETYIPEESYQVLLKPIIISHRDNSIVNVPVDIMGKTSPLATVRVELLAPDSVGKLRFIRTYETRANEQGIFKFRLFSSQQSLLKYYTLIFRAIDSVGRTTRSTIINLEID